MKLPDEFHQARVDLEVDLGEKGGLQRFKTVGDVQKWLDEEKEFWHWMDEAPASNHHSALSELMADYRRFDDTSRSALFRAKNRWGDIRTAIREQSAILADKSNSDETREQAKSEREQLSNELTTLIEELTKHINRSITTEVVKSPCYLTRFDPAANFIKELAEKEPDEALFALDQIILEVKQSGERRRVEHSGRLLATLHTRNLYKGARHDKRAFEQAIVTWAAELADFKARYEAQEAEFEEISTRHAAADEAWSNRADRMAEEFSEMRQQKEADLNNLKSTFETHMQLKGPLIYWRGKRREHTIGKKRMAWASGISGAVGAVAIAGVAYLFLPEETASQNIPWRNIALFLFLSTFILWLVRLFVKLMLSHIHLAADAREREVMISTFMALMRRQEGREGVEKMDLALILAPIFKPSTTGVIKDDGGPTTLTDFISRLAGK